MSFLNKFFVKISAKKIGEDLFGNEYYEGRSKNYLGDFKRYVIYNGFSEPSKVPPPWRVWLHGLSENPPSKGGEKGYEPNLTGTKFRYDPKKSYINRKKDEEEKTLIWKP